MTNDRADKICNRLELLALLLLGHWILQALIWVFP